MPALGTQAGAGRASREGTAHAASTSAPSTSPLSAARPPGACSVSSWHCHVLLSWRSSFSSLILSATRYHSAASLSIQAILVLSGTARSVATAPPATEATGHGKCVPVQIAAEPVLDDLAQVAGDERDRLDAICGDHFTDVRCRTPAQSDRPGMQMRFSSSDVLRLLSTWLESIRRANVDPWEQNHISNCKYLGSLASPNMEGWRMVAVALLKAWNGDARTLLYSLRTIACPVDMSPASRVVLSWAGLSAQVFDAKVNVLHAESLDPPRCFTQSQLEALAARTAANRAILR
jgi:hypothetical protein